ncbi:MAG: acyl-CoA dehydrogenase family protein [Acidimicrobiia bacterium]|nr:acyl-CoA dehydrogenase family protein [Acidimicrobiia bacterium]
MSWQEDARRTVERMQDLVDSAAAHLASVTRRDGRISTEMLDQHQEAVYHLAFLAAETAMSRVMIDYSEYGESELEIGRIAVADLLRSARARVDGRRMDLGIDDDLRGEPCDRVLVAGSDPGVIGKLNASFEESNTGPQHLDEDIALVAETFKRFTREQVAPHAEGVHRHNLDVPEELINGMAAMGAFGMSIPTDHGGFQVPDAPGLLSMAVATEELSRGSLMAGSLLTRPEILVSALLEGGTDGQKMTWLPRIAAGTQMVAVSVTEPDIGSDVASLRMSARPDGDQFVLNGAKMWATFAGRAELLMLLARTNPDSSAGARGLSLFVVEKPPFAGHEFAIEQPGGGSLRGRAIDTIGYRGLHSFELTFDDYLVPFDALIGGEPGLGRGFYLQMGAFASGRLQTAARALGVMQAAFDEALAYCRTRRVFGRPLLEFELTANTLARMAARIQANRQFTYQAARLLSEGEGQIEAAMAKALASRAAEEITRDAMQLHGGYGYAEEYPISRLFVDARVLSIFEGTEEVLALRVIGKGLLETAARNK